MFRFAPKDQAPPPPDLSTDQPTPADPTVNADAEGDDDASPDIQDSKVPPQVAGYKDPKQGPFQCSNCTFWLQPNSCSIVDGKIDPAGICNNFHSGAGPDDSSPDQPDDSQAPDATGPDSGVPPALAAALQGQ